MKTTPISRRTAVKSAAFGLLAVAMPRVLFSRSFVELPFSPSQSPEVFHRYPSIDDAIVEEVVGASHFNFERVKALVTARPELARATWDWAFGDWETALGAASHVGRRDIAQFLISKGARPDIFTLAMLGHYPTVKSMIEAMPGIEASEGPHGISLLRHAEAGLRTGYGIDLTQEQIDASEQLISYLEGLGTADAQPTNLEMSEAEKEKFLGDYMYGEGPKDGLTVKLNMRKHLSLGKLGTSGGSLYQISPGLFSYNGTPSVRVQFTIENDQVLSLTLTEPDLTLKAVKV